MPDTLVLHWPRWDRHLLCALAPGIARLAIRPGEPAQAAVERILRRAARPRRVLLHIDASTPGDFVRPFEALGPLLETEGIGLWNGSIADIRKRRLQASIASLGLPCTLAMRDGPPEELVIVKTDLNNHGNAERRASDLERAALGWGPRSPSPLDGRGYLVMARSEMPAGWWDDGRIVVERYIGNRAGLFHRAYVVGEQVVLCEGRTPDRLRHLRDAGDRYDFLLDRRAAREPLVAALLGSPAAESFQSAVVYAERCGVDYGSLDLVADDAGIPFIVDLNTTPYWGAPPGAEAMLGHLRQGLKPAGRRAEGSPTSAP
jgi:hypothetical protein